jgi:penicillin-binding protein 2
MMDAHLLGYYLNEDEFVPPAGFHHAAIIKRANAYIAERNAVRIPDAESSATSDSSSSAPKVTP